MAASRPPPAHAAVPTSFKRSFDELTVDLDTNPQQAGTSDAHSGNSANSSSNGGAERNKRARSGSVSSDDEHVIQEALFSAASSTASSASGSRRPSSDSATHSQPSALGRFSPLFSRAAASENVSEHSAAGIYTQEPEIMHTPPMDVELVDPLPFVPASHASTNQPLSSSLPMFDENEHYRLSMERFSTFDSHISILRDDHSPPRASQPSPSAILPGATQHAAGTSLSTSPEAQDREISPTRSQVASSPFPPYFDTDYTEPILGRLTPPTPVMTEIGANAGADLFPVSDTSFVLEHEEPLVQNEPAASPQTIDTTASGRGRPPPWVISSDARQSLDSHRIAADPCASEHLREAARRVIDAETELFSRWRDVHGGNSSSMPTRQTSSPVMGNNGHRPTPTNGRPGFRRLVLPINVAASGSTSPGSNGSASRGESRPHADSHHSRPPVSYPRVPFPSVYPDAPTLGPQRECPYVRHPAPHATPAHSTDDTRGYIPWGVHDNRSTQQASGNIHAAHRRPSFTNRLPQPTRLLNRHGAPNHDASLARGRLPSLDSMDLLNPWSLGPGTRYRPQQYTHARDAPRSSIPPIECTYDMSSSRASNAHSEVTSHRPVESTLSRNLALFSERPSVPTATSMGTTSLSDNRPVDESSTRSQGLRWYYSRPSASNSLMSENAAEIRRRIGRDEVHSTPPDSSYPVMQLSRPESSVVPASEPQVTPPTEDVDIVLDVFALRRQSNGAADGDPPAGMLMLSDEDGSGGSEYPTGTGTRARSSGLGASGESGQVNEDTWMSALDYSAPAYVDDGLPSPFHWYEARLMEGERSSNSARLPPIGGSHSEVLPPIGDIGFRDGRPSPMRSDYPVFTDHGALHESQSSSDTNSSAQSSEGRRNRLMRSVMEHRAAIARWTSPATHESTSSPTSRTRPPLSSTLSSDISMELAEARRRRREVETLPDLLRRFAVPNGRTGRPSPPTEPAGEEAPRYSDFFPSLDIRELMEHAEPSPRYSPPSGPEPPWPRSAQTPWNAAQSAASTGPRQQGPLTPYDHINLNDYHDGPIRATLARSIELNRLRNTRNNTMVPSSAFPTSQPLRVPDPYIMPFPTSPSPPPGDSSETVPSTANLEARVQRLIRRSADFEDDIASREAAVRRRSALLDEEFQQHSRHENNLDDLATVDRGVQAREQRQLHNILARRSLGEMSRPSAASSPNTSNASQASGLRPEDAGPPRRLHSRFNRPLHHWGELYGEDTSGTYRPDVPSRHRDREMEWTTRRLGLSEHTHAAPGLRDRSSSHSPTHETDPHVPSASRRAAERDARRQASLRRQAALGDLFDHRFPASRGGLRARGRALGDYVRDEDLDTSYEGLLQLTASLGEVRPRGTSEAVINNLPSALYRDWATPNEASERCPICLDDYQETDPVLKVPDCAHWFHKACLQQWLKGARTCPVCRAQVDRSASSQSQSQGRLAPRPPFGPLRRRLPPRTGAGPGPSGGGTHPADRGTTNDSGNDNGDRPSILRPARHWDDYL